MSGGIISGADMMRLLSGGGPPEEKKKSPPDVLVRTLQEIHDRYVKPCPFKVGDLVTARAGYNRVGAGDPAIVVEVFDPPLRVLLKRPDDIGSAQCMANVDIRIAHEIHGMISMHCEESWIFEPYVGKIDDTATKN